MIRGSNLADELGGLVGENRVRAEVGCPQVFHVSPASSEEVLSVLTTAKKRKLPLLQRAPGLDTSDVTMPREGGIILDLRLLNRVLEIEHTERYAVVEPGVTWQGLEKRLLEEGGDLALPVTSTPSGIGPWTTFLFDGAEGAGLSLGNESRFLLGVEAILATGETVKTGASAATGRWWGRGPGTDMTSLFARWRGASGIVTRLAVALDPRPRHARRLLIPSSKRRLAMAASIRLARTELFDETHVIPWTLPRVLLGASRPRRRLPGEPEAWLAVDFRADSLPDLEYKRVHLAQALSRASKRGGRFDDPLPLSSVARVCPSLAMLGDLPLRLPEALCERGGDTAPRLLSCHGPVRAMVDGASKVDEAYGEIGLPAGILMRPSPGGDHGILHVIPPAATNGQEDRDELLAAERRLVEILDAAGFVIHRYPREHRGLVNEVTDEGSTDLTIRLRRTIDPENMLEPTRWGLLPP